MLLFSDINVKYQRQISLIETCRFSFPPPRLSMWSGTDVKSLATFSSGPDPSERPRRKCSK